MQRRSCTPPRAGDGCSSSRSRPRVAPSSSSRTTPETCCTPECRRAVPSLPPRASRIARRSGASRSPDHYLCGVALSTFLFDLDGTLIDSIELILRSYRHTMRTHRGLEPPDEVWMQGLGTPLWVQFRHWTEDPAEIDAMVATYRAYNLEHHDAMVRPYDGVVAAVRDLKRRNKTLGLVTSKMRSGARRGSEDRRRAVGAVRPLPPGRSRARLLAGAPGRHQLADGRQLTADSAFRRCALRFVPFELERWQSTWENRVRFNLSESGVHPLTVQELLGIAGASALPLLEVRLGYSQSNGTDLLRGRIAALYPGASPEQILVTTGSSEANFLVCWRLVEPGDKVALMLPNYLQTWGLAQNFGAEVRGFQLHPEKAWEPFAEEIRTAIAPGTKLVVVTNPHNPTGHVLSDAARRTILERTAEVGAWLLADEVYQGAELDGKTTPSFWGGYERVIAVNGLSKAYGLPGLRIGWIVAPPALSTEAWARPDYTTIGPSGATDHLAAVALQPRGRGKLLERTRRLLKANYPALEGGLKRFGDNFTWQPPQAGAAPC